MHAPKLIVVGAGASGIAAASRLLEYGFTDVTILEAENRTGGRIHTEEFGDGIIELGAQWVHGEEGNVVFNLANPLNLLTESITSLFDSTTTYVESNGRSFQIHEMPHVFEIIGDIDKDSKNFFKTNMGSVGEYFTKEFQKRLEKRSVPSQDWPVAQSILEWYEKLENSIDASDSWFETSGHGLTQYWDCEGNLLWSWKSGGYRTVLDLLMKKYPYKDKELPLLNKILLNKEVKKIIWDKLQDDKEGKVVAECTDGSTYVADHLVVTLSLGVLKERASTLFFPSLPEEKLLSIKGLAIGTVNKMFLKFPYRWWPTDVQGFNFLWSKEDKDEFIKANAKRSRDKSWLEGVFGFYALDNQPLILYSWAVGSHGRHMEQLTDSEVTDDLMELLNKFLGGKFNIPQPDELKRSSWTSNPHFRGSYSFRSMESDNLGANACQLAKPVCSSLGKEVLLFAGEATHDHYYSTVHGAIETGWREADRLKRLYQQSTIYKTIIVGAGISGLAAARTLIEAGINNILILEAQNHAGGRIFSVPQDGGWLEAGAQWIHGQNNEVWRIANQQNLLSDIISAEGEGLYLREDGVVIEPRIIHEVFSAISEILEECEDLVNRDEIGNEVPVSIGHHLKKRFLEYLENCNNDSEDIKNMKYELYNWHVRFQIIDNSCTVLEKLSAKAWGKYKFCGGTDYVNFKEGYSSLTKYLVDSLPYGVLNLQCPVKKINWKNVIEAPKQKNLSSIRKSDSGCETGVCSNPHSISTCSVQHSNDENDVCQRIQGKNMEEIKAPVQIECEDGVYLFAEHVIITCSLGYLKENHESIFTPHLPETFVKAIEDLGFATINKVYLIYQEPWWTKNIKGFQLIWLKSNTTKINYTEASSWTHDLTGFDVLPNHKAVLLGWVGGKGAQLVETLSESEIGEQCTVLLRKFTQQFNIPRPHKVVRTTWYSNPYIRGGYSNTSTFCDQSRVGPSTLIEPVCAEMINTCCSTLPSSEKYPALLFAGEATHETFFSTTHGAYETGQKQAEVVIAYNKMNSIKLKES